MTVVVISHEHLEEQGVYKIVLAEELAPAAEATDEQEARDAVYGTSFSIVWADDDRRWIDARGRRLSDAKIRDAQRADAVKAIKRLSEPPEQPQGRALGGGDTLM